MIFPENSIPISPFLHINFGESVFQQVLSNDPSHSVLVICGGSHIRGLLDRLLGVFHGDSKPGGANHSNIVQTVADGDHLRHIHPKESANLLQSAGLANTRGIKFDIVDVGIADFKASAASRIHFLFSADTPLFFPSKVPSISKAINL
jgi:hypothetical protein